MDDKFENTRKNRHSATEHLFDTKQEGPTWSRARLLNLSDELDRTMFTIKITLTKIIFFNSPLLRGR